MLRVFWFLLKRGFKERYVTYWSFLSESMFVALSVVIYWYTASAFASSFEEKFQGLGMDYFSFVLFGDLALFIPLMLFEGPSRIVRTALQERTLDFYLLYPKGPQFLIICEELANIPREMTRIFLTLFIASLLFPFKISLGSVLALVPGLLLAVPMGLGLGLIGAAVFVKFGRGGTILSYLSSVSALLAGAYFPTTVFPPWVHRISEYLVPFTKILDGIRRLMNFGWTDPTARQYLEYVVLAGVLVFAAGYLLLEASFYSLRKNGPLLKVSL